MKTILKRISAGALAAVFLATFAVPRSKAVVEGFDIVAVANAVVDTHLAALGGEFVIKTGGSSALAAGTESLFTQAGAAGAFGAGVTGATAMGTIAAGVAAFSGGFVLGYEGYQVVTQFIEWLKENKLISADQANTIWVYNGSGDTLIDGRNIASMGFGNVDRRTLEFGKIYSTQLGSSFWVNFSEVEPKKTYSLSLTTISNKNIVKEYVETYDEAWSLTAGDSKYAKYDISVQMPYKDDGNGQVIVGTYHGNKFFPAEYSHEKIFKDVFTPAPSGEEKQEVTYAPPATWSPPAPAPGQSVLYKPFSNAPDKGLEDIIADVPDAIASGNFKPAATTVIDTPTPEPPPTPDVPPTVNPNPDVEVPEDVTPYTVKIGEVFPFCIPFDLYHMVTMFSAEPEAPHAKWTFSLPWSPAQEYKVEWDLKKFDDLAELCRKLELVLFCVGLAVVTSKLIKW